MLLVVINIGTDTTPNYLYYAHTGLNSGDGSFVPTISGFPHTGQSFLTRIENQDIAATQALSEQGISTCSPSGSRQSRRGPACPLFSQGFSSCAVCWSIISNQFPLSKNHHQ